MTPDVALQVRSRADCLYPRAAVEAALVQMATHLTQRLAQANPVVLCVMNGGLIVAGELVTRLDFPLSLDYLQVSRYRDRTQGGDLNWRRYPATDLQGRSVLLVDDILDEGVTLAAVRDWCLAQGARDVMIAVLVEKQLPQRTAAIQADVVGLPVPDRFVFGYGMDFQGYWRNAPGIFAVHPDDLSV